MGERKKQKRQKKNAKKRSFVPSDDICRYSQTFAVLTPSLRQHLRMEKPETYNEMFSLPKADLIKFARQMSKNESSAPAGLTKKEQEKGLDTLKLFPSQNQAHFCWQKYNEFVLCLRKNDGDAEPCFNSRFEAGKACPDEWMEDWDDQRAEGRFMGIQDKKPE